MLAAERRNLILEKVHEEKKVIVSELSKEFDVSEETIRRDLDRLEEDGHVIKGYGGAVVNERDSIDIPFNLRRKANPIGKQKIAQLVRAEIADGDHIFLDASTTAVFIAKSIKEKKHLTVITNSIENMLELSDAQGVDIVATGGHLNADTMSLLGKKSADTINSYNADKIFFSCKGIDLKSQITDGNDDTAGIKQAMISSSGKIYLAVDSTKFNKTALAKITDLKNIDTVITDKKPDDMWLNAFAQNKVTCIYPND